MAAILTDLPAGHAFQPLSFKIDAARARSYREAAGDATPAYDEAGFVPPLAVAAFALGALLESVGLPAGSLHASESVTFVEPVAPDARAVCRASLAQRSQRSGWIVSVLDSEIEVDGRTALRTRATVLSPVAPA